MQFNYLSQGFLFGVSEPLGSEEHLTAVKNAFRVLELERYFPAVLRVLAAILMLGNVAITAGPDDFATVADSLGASRIAWAPPANRARVCSLTPRTVFGSAGVHPALTKAAELLQAPKPSIVDVLKVRRVKTASDTVATPLTVPQVPASLRAHTRRTHTLTHRSVEATFGGCIRPSRHGTRWPRRSTIACSSGSCAA